MRSFTASIIGHLQQCSMKRDAVKEMISYLKRTNIETQKLTIQSHNQWKEADLKRGHHL